MPRIDFGKVPDLFKSQDCLHYPLTMPERAFLWWVAKGRAEGKTTKGFSTEYPRSNYQINYCGTRGEWAFHRMTAGTFYHNPDSRKGDGGVVDSILPDTEHLGPFRGNTVQIKTSCIRVIPKLMLIGLDPNKHADLYALCWSPTETDARIVGFATLEDVNSVANQRGCATIPAPDLRPAVCLAHPERTKAYKPRFALTAAQPYWGPTSLDSVPENQRDGWTNDAMQTYLREEHLRTIFAQFGA